MRNPRIPSSMLALVLAVGCGSQTPEPVPPPPPPAPLGPPPASAAEVVPPAPPPPSADAGVPSAAPTPKGPVPAVRYTGFSVPESVLYDEAGDRYWVSNINGKPTDTDNNGFISVLSPDGQVTSLKFIEGGKNKVKLDAPKGLALVKDVLYVSDISTVRMFDANSGAPKGEIRVPGATFLNDLASAPDGTVFVSDSGLKSGPKGFASTGTDAVYAIKNGRLKAIAKGKDLEGPNGLLSTDKGPIVVTFSSNEVYRLNAKGAKEEVTRLPKGGLDGVVALGSELLVSSWEASTIYLGRLGGPFEAVLTEQTSPADIGYDTKRGRVLVPHFAQDTVEAYDLK